ncbi:MAG: CHAP domain-containing protein, partial [Leptolyngbyaceae cyanobacterium CAN_BIN12]|nr:CHAP domain-containing protein [Leptolyngbyaceae cyanobacterium CAN_BIN12]
PTSTSYQAQASAPTYQEQSRQSSSPVDLSGYGGMYSQVKLPDDSQSSPSRQSRERSQPSTSRRMSPDQPQYDAATGECICAEYVARRAGIPNVNEVAGSNEDQLEAAGYQRSVYPRAGGIALLDKNLPGLTKPDSRHIAFVEGVDDGIPIVAESNSGGTDSGYGCTNVSTARRADYLSPGVSFWAKN